MTIEDLLKMLKEVPETTLVVGALKNKDAAEIIIPTLFVDCLNIPFTFSKEIYNTDESRNDNNLRGILITISLPKGTNYYYSQYLHTVKILRDKLSNYNKFNNIYIGNGKDYYRAKSITLQRVTLENGDLRLISASDKVGYNCLILR